MTIFLLAAIAAAGALLILSTVQIVRGIAQMRRKP